MPSRPKFDWFLNDWLATLGKTQTDLQRLTGWSKRKASDLCSGEQRYNRDSLNDAAFALHLSPYELLLHPHDAMAMRKIREGGLSLAAEMRTPNIVEPLKLEGGRTGTTG